MTDIETLQRFFGWFTLIHIGLYIYSVTLASFAQDWLYRNKTERFGFQMSREVFTVVMFSMIGLYKILIIVLGIVPWLALKLCG